MRLYIRNMACESCKVVVREALEDLGIKPVSVSLGEAEVKGTVPEKKKIAFNNKIRKAGLELVKNKAGVLSDQIKALVLDYVLGKQDVRIKLSDYLSHKLNYDYSYLSSYFSAMQATTIEQFAINARVERVKELLVLEQHTLAEITKLMGYSSPSHLSGQFRKITGLPPSHFKKLGMLRRKTIQALSTEKNGH